MRTPRRTPGLLVSVALLLPAVRPGAAATSGEPADAERSPIRESFWGPVPARADSVSLTIPARPTPTRDRVVDAPWQVAAIPLRLAVDGVGATVVYLDETRALHRLKALFGPRELPYGLLVNVSYGDLAGVGGGATFLHDRFFGPDNRFRLGFTSSFDTEHKITSGMHLGVGHPTELQIGAGFRDRSARYFGLGPTSREDRESLYRQELGWVGIQATRRLAWGLAIEPGVLFSEAHARGSREKDDPPLATEFQGDLPTGYGHRSDGVAFSLGLEHDSTVETGRPVSGGYRRVVTSYFTGTRDDEASFWTYRAELQHFFPLWYRHQALAVRTFYTWIDPASGKDVPFQRLMTNDDPDLLRGYRDFRWRDRGMALLSVEYRWPVWALEAADGVGVDAYLFTDLGQVFGDPDEISSDNMTTSYGLGLRIISTPSFLGRVEVARSDEGTVLRVRADQVFQFHKGDLFSGRNPIPSR